MMRVLRRNLPGILLGAFLCSIVFMIIGERDSSSDEIPPAALLTENDGHAREAHGEHEENILAEKAAMVDSRQEELRPAHPAGSLADYLPISLELKLPSEYIDDPVLKSREQTFKHYGFNLAVSNRLPLDRKLPDLRNNACKSQTYPKDMLKTSVIIIFYNEPLSTLLRNVVSVLNNSPPELLGEIVLVDDNSTLPELKFLPEHLSRLRVPNNLIRLVRRNVHDGIVGARIRGAKEATQEVILFLDSHAEVSPGWLEPLIFRIYQDRTRVVVPNIRGFNLDTLDITQGDFWPPAKGSFNWRLAFTIVPADIDKDLTGASDRHAAVVKSPIMPGGLFAMDREFFFKLGAYDPEIKYYGAEHVELSFRVWMCGGSMEWVPCSNVGHIYREFNRFAVDPQLKNVNIGRILDRNDKRVAEVWMDQYKDIVYDIRHLHNLDTGDVSARKQLRRDLQCKSFDWFLKNVASDLYVPPLERVIGTLHSPDNKLCLDNAGKHNEPALSYPCVFGNVKQHWSMGDDGYIVYREHVNHELVCLRVETVALVKCGDAPKWKLVDGMIQVDDPSAAKAMCIEAGSDHKLKLNECQTSLGRQQWSLQHAMSGGNTMVSSSYELCLDNMQKPFGAPGLYGCHGGATQSWIHRPDGKLQSKSFADSCIGHGTIVNQFMCLPNEDSYKWTHRADGRVSPATHPTKCLQRLEGNGLGLASCRETEQAQEWEFSPV